MRRKKRYYAVAVAVAVAVATTIAVAALALTVPPYVVQSCLPLAGTNAKERR